MTFPVLSSIIPIMSRPWVTVDRLKDHIGETVELRGWVYNTRSSGKIRFLILRDGSGIVQAILYSADKNSPLFQRFDTLTMESSVVIWGKVKEEPRAPGGVEMEMEDFEIVQVSPEYPIQKKEHTTSFLMPLRHLWIRSQKQYAILKVREIVVWKVREFLRNEGFLLVDTPILTPSSCEGTTSLFQTQSFDEKAYLSQSGQLYNEANAMAFGKVYCFGPTFRAEKSKTRRHLIEFWMVEPEAAYYNFEEMMGVAERFIEYIVQETLKEGKEYFQILERDTSSLEKLKTPFPRITYKDAFKILREENSETPDGEDFGGTDETVISNRFDGPVFVTRFPAKIKAFYMQPDPEDAEATLSFDLLAPEGYGEIIGGSERIHDYDLLVKKIHEHGYSEDDYRWYLDLRKYGSVPHSGFGMGLERMVCWLTGIHHIREAIPYPRTLNNLYP